MRYYDIQIDGQTFCTSHPDGNQAPPDPGALMVELDLPQGVEHIPQGGGTVKIWGCDIQSVTQSKNFTSKKIAIYGGMGVGFPLATAQAPQAGLLVQGSIYPSIGTWTGNEISLLFAVSNLPAAEGSFKPANLVVTHNKGDHLGDVMKQSLMKAYPTFDVNVNISDMLTLDHPGAGFYQTINQFSDACRKISLSMMDAGGFAPDGTYPGVMVGTHGTTITISDGTKPASDVKTINFYDLVGQPSWVSLNQISVSVVLRGDLKLLDHIKLPPTPTTSTAASNPQLRDSSAFQGEFIIREIRHVGNSRSPDGNAWVTTLTCLALGVADS